MEINVFLFLLIHSINDFTKTPVSLENFSDTGMAQTKVASPLSPLHRG